MPITDQDLQELRRTVSGRVARPTDAGVTDLTAGYQQRDPHRPDVVVVAADAADVATAVRFAADRDLPVAAQSTGHGRAAGLDGGVLVATGGLDELTVDPTRRSVRTGAGVRWQAVLDAAAEHGLAPLSGSSPGVGVVGYLLGGGIGLLGRRFGYAADRLTRIDLVTVDGTERVVTADSDRELFRALRGGGGSFGVVTAVEFGLVPVATVLGGSLTVDVADHPDVLSVWRDWSLTLPDTVTTGASLLTMPDLEPIPEPLRGRQIASIQVCATTSADEAETFVAPLRAALSPIRDTVREMPFRESGSISEEPDRPHAYRSTARAVSSLPDVGVDALLHASSPDAEVATVVNVRRLGGAFAAPPAVPDAIGHRDAAFAVYALAAVDDDTVAPAARLQQATFAAFDDDAGATLGTSSSFAYGPMTEAERRRAFDDGVYDDLAALARHLDPDGRLAANHPVR